MKTAILAAAARPAITSTVSALTDRALLRQTSTLVRHERHLQGAVIDYLAEIETRRLYLQRGCSSLFDYAVRELGYSYAAAARRIGAVRLCADQPGARERLRDGSLTLSAAAERSPPPRRPHRPRGRSPRRRGQRWPGPRRAAGRPGAPARRRPLRAEGGHRRRLPSGVGPTSGAALAPGPEHDDGAARRPLGAGGAGPPRPEPAATPSARRQPAGGGRLEARCGSDAAGNPGTR